MQTQPTKKKTRFLKVPKSLDSALILYVLLASACREAFKVEQIPQTFTKIKVPKIFRCSTFQIDKRAIELSLRRPLIEEKGPPVAILELKTYFNGENAGAAKWASHSDWYDLYDVNMIGAGIMKDIFVTFRGRKSLVKKIETAIDKGLDRIDPKTSLLVLPAEWWVTKSTEPL